MLNVSLSKNLVEKSMLLDSTIYNDASLNYTFLNFGITGGQGIERMKILRIEIHWTHMLTRI